jgi:AbrB family looped-hinge helix DNA binding protein
MRITSKGQVTIPVEIRERAGLLPHTEVDFVLEGDTVRLVPASRTAEGEGKRNRGQMLTRRLRGAATARLSTEEIMALTRGE